MSRIFTRGFPLVRSFTPFFINGSERNDREKNVEESVTLERILNYPKMERSKTRREETATLINT